jgi:hypothetical protein
MPLIGWVPRQNAYPKPLDRVTDMARSHPSTIIKGAKGHSKSFILTVVVSYWIVNAFVALAAHSSKHKGSYTWLDKGPAEMDKIRMARMFFCRKA